MKAFLYNLRVQIATNTSSEFPISKDIVHLMVLWVWVPGTDSIIQGEPNSVREISRRKRDILSTYTRDVMGIILGLLKGGQAKLCMLREDIIPLEPVLIWTQKCINP